MASTFLLGGMFAVASWSTLFPNSRPVETAVASTPALAPVPGPAPRARAADVAKAEQVSAADLWTAYMRDPAAADRQYRDRSLVVSGTVRSVDRDFDGGVVVRLSTGGASETVNAKLATREDPWAVGSTRGKQVSLLCVGRGSAIGSPLLGSCTVSSSG